MKLLLAAPFSSVYLIWQGFFLFFVFTIEVLLDANLMGICLLPSLMFHSIKVGIPNIDFQAEFV